MRILTRRIYRAFPELDRYGDEQCDRFVRAACRAKIPWAFRTFAALLLGAVVALIGMLLAGALLGALGPGFDPSIDALSWKLIVSLPLILLCLAPGPVVGFLARDRLLRGRVRYILRARGVCAGCRYSLIGVPVRDRTTVTCPECGLDGHVDESLGELVLNDAGQPVYAPAPGMVKVPRVFTPKRVRVFKRGAAWTALVLVFGLPIAWGGYEVFLLRQAAKARAEKPGPKALIALVEQAQPPGVDLNDTSQPDAWVTFGRAVAIRDATDARVWRASPPQTSDGKEVYPDPSSIGFVPAADTRDAAQKEYDALAEKVARELLEQYRADGLYTALDEIAATRRAVRPVNVPPGQPLMLVLLPELGQARQFARINSGRMRVAKERGDLREFVNAFESTLSLARIEHSQPFLIDGLVGIAIEALAYSRLRELLYTRPGPEVLDGISQAIERQWVPITLVHTLRGERLSALDATAFVFGDPSNIRFGQFSKKFRNSVGGFGGGVNPRLLTGTYEGNKAAFAKYFDSVEQLAMKPRWERASAAIGEPESRYVLVNLMLPAIGKALSSYDQIELDRRGVPIMIALERFRHEAGRYPAALSELVPRHLRELPIDPWSGASFGYTLTDPASDPQGRGYLLYTVAADGVDNGGKMPSGTGVKYHVLTAPVAANAAGYDFVINDRDR